VLGLVLALLAALSWGVSDFLGGMATRTVPVIRVLAVSQPIGLVLCTVALVISGQSLPAGWHLLQALAAGVAAVVALGLLYLALAHGNAVIVAPIAATGAAVPVAIGIALGDPMTGVTGIATLLALTGIVAASWESGDETAAGSADRHSRGATIGLALGAALATGLYLTLINLASESGQYLGVVQALRLAASVVAVIAYLCWHATIRDPRRRAQRSPGVPADPAARRRSGLLLLAMAGVGATDAVAEACYAGASTRGVLSVVAVLAGLYPVVTVALSLLVLRQRVQLVQGLGAVAALTGVLLFTASS